MIGLHSPKHINAVVSCLSVICDTLSGNSKKEFIEDMKVFAKRLDDVPNSEYMKIWVQRFFIGSQIDFEDEQSGKLLQAVIDSKNGKGISNFWNMNWLDQIEDKKAFLRKKTLSLIIKRLKM